MPTAQEILDEIRERKRTGEKPPVDPELRKRLGLPPRYLEKRPPATPPARRPKQTDGFWPEQKKGGFWPEQWKSARQHGNGDATQS